MNNYLSEKQANITHLDKERDFTKELDFTKSLDFSR